MTRAQQTISIALLVTSVRLLTSKAMLRTLLMSYIALSRPLLRLHPPSTQDPTRNRTSCTLTFRYHLQETVRMFWRLTTRFLQQLPFWALVSFGAYLLFKLGYNVYNFNDVPEAHKELMAQIEQAKTELRAKGVDVD